jgi:hypothetical protein
MQSCHAAHAVDVAFDDPNLIADAGLVPVVALAEQVGLPKLVAEHVWILDAANGAGANPVAKVMSLLAGMVAGADSIADVDRLRHAGNDLVFEQVRAPSTVGTFLRAFTHGHVQQLNRVLREFLVALCARVNVLPGADQVVFVDLDSTHRQVYGYAKEGAAVGRHKGKKTLHPLIASVSTPIARPVLAGIRLRRGKAADVRGAARFLAETLAVVRRIAPNATLVVRGDSKFYTAKVVAAAARYGAAVSLTTGSNPDVNTTIAAIADAGWTAIHYPDAFVDTDTGELISDAEVAEVPYTAFASKPATLQAHGRLIVRRVKRKNPNSVGGTSRWCRTSCSPPGLTTRCSSPQASRCCRPKDSTATTPSSSRSSPTPPHPRWPTCRPGSSPPTRRGPCSGRSPTTSPAPPAPWPARSTPVRPRPRSGLT